MGLVEKHDFAVSARKRDLTIFIGKQNNLHFWWKKNLILEFMRENDQNEFY